MLRVLEGAKRGFDLVPPALVLQGLPNGRCDKSAALPAANPRIESAD
jgi:hypothetical protein